MLRRFCAQAGAAVSSVNNPVYVIISGIACVGMYLHRENREDIQGLRVEISGLRVEIGGIKQEISSVKQDVAELKGMLYIIAGLHEREQKKEVG